MPSPHETAVIPETAGRARRSGWITALVAALALSAGAASASAQDVPVDVPIDVAGVDEGAELALPDAPEDYAREQRGDVRWEFPAQASAVAHSLQEVYRDEWHRVTEELGGEVDAELVIRVGRNPEEMRALAPIGAPPPAYASGVAYPRRGLVLLTLTAPESWQRPDMESVLVHELSHIALHRAVNGTPVPRWFSEGVAIHQAREQSLDRMRTLWGATAGERLLPFERLSRGFPSQPHRVNLAYAQSADFVRWLLGRNDGERKFHEVLRRIREGQAFQTALERTYSVTMTRLELDWHESLGERFQAMPLLLGSGTLWVVAALLIVVAYARRKSKDKEKLEEWEREDRETHATAKAWISVGQTSATSGPSPTHPDDDVEVLYVVPPEPRRRDSSVPTIEHEGRNHTLH